MEKETREISLTCPICKKKNTIKIPEKILGQKKFGSIKIQIPPGAVCPDHQFIVFLDPKGLVRGYEKIDVFMGDEHAESEQKEMKTEISVNQLVKQFGLYGLFSLLHSKLFNYHSYIIREDTSNFDFQKLNEFLNDISDNDYLNPQDIEILEEQNYEGLKLDKNNTLLINENNNIIHTPWNEKLKLEEEFIRNALDILNPNEQKIIIKQNVNSFLKKVKHTIRILEDVKKINNQDLTKKISKDLNLPEPNNNEIEMIKEFVIRNISKKLGNKIIKRTEAFLGSL
ncbi:MAG: hypothetical protein EU541_01450 [Promethearchaeota archaeon]|nr:MAG: hypothetical protein EU541_01450 [Candidatus Lokiarchaeota archaeon]